MFSEEQPALKTLPDTAFSLFKIGRRKVNPLDSHIEVHGAYYPIPLEYMGKHVDVHFNQDWVKVYYKGERIQWLSTVDKGRFHPDKRCLPENKALDRNGWQRRVLYQCNKIGPSVRTWADEAVKTRGLASYRAIQGVVALDNKYPDGVINQACAMAIDRQAFSYHLIRNFAEEQRLQKEMQTRLHLTQDHEIIRKSETYADLMERTSS